MGDITAAGVTVTLAVQDSYNPPGQPKVSFPTIAFGNASDTYPTHGIPLPAMGLLGMFEKEIKRILITPVPGDGYIYKYDKTYGTIRIYEAPTAGSLTATANLHDATLTIAAPTGNVANLAVDANTALHSGLLTMQAPTGNLANKVVDIVVSGGAGVGQLTEFTGAAGGLRGGPSSAHWPSSASPPKRRSGMHRSASVCATASRIPRRSGGTASSWSPRAGECPVSWV